MEKILISGSSNIVVKEIEARISELANIKYVTVFFENENFLITKYRPLSNGVCLIIELDDRTELHIEGGNCGYGGGGPHATLNILRLFGLQETYLEELIFGNDAVRFSVEDHQIITSTIDTSYLFYPGIRETDKDKSMRNKIRTDENVDVDLEKAKIMIYNPQRNCWNGMLNLLSYMDDIEFEYYIGSYSPLEGGLYLGKNFNGALQGRCNRPDMKGVEHVNLVLQGAGFKVICLIDRMDEREVIESVYLSLTGKRLFGDGESDFSMGSVCRRLVKSLKGQPKELYDKMHIVNKRLGNGLV